MSSSVIRVRPLGFPWQGTDPFLFCVHHDDHYPPGNAQLGPAASLVGRNLGRDFEVKDGWRMYHGRTVPGFPPHPHRGFETVTIVRRGFIDHSDSLGASARFGNGDVQWLTAGAGVVHSEMFPLLADKNPNPLEFFQIWLNLAAVDKLSPPHFSMFWDKDVPVRTQKDAGERTATVTVVAGRYLDAVPPPPPPHSWASRPSSDVAIWLVHMQAGAQWELPKAEPGTHRTLYLYKGGPIHINESTVQTNHTVELNNQTATLIAGTDGVDLLLLQGQPISEPVVQHGPFVMTSREEIAQAFQDYERSRFGGWPWKSDEPVHAKDAGRFATYPDGGTKRP